MTETEYPDELVAAIAAEVALAMVAADRTAPKGPKPDLVNSRRLSKIDQELRSKLLVACNAAAKRVLERAGSKIISKSRVASAAPIRERIRGLETWQIPSTLGMLTITAALGLHERDLIDTELADLHKQFNDWTAAAQDASIRTASKIAATSPAAIYAISNQRYNNDRQAGWETLKHKIVEAIGEVLGGERELAEGAAIIGLAPIRAAIAIAGGYNSMMGSQGITDDLKPVDSSRPLTGIGTGDTLESALSEFGVERSSYIWQHGLSDRPFEPHLALDGFEFSSWDDDGLVNDDFPYDEQFFYPGDHAGCSCDVQVIYTPGAGEDGGVDSGATDAVDSGMAASLLPRTREFEYNPDQPRGDDGKWVSTGESSDRSSGGRSSDQVGNVRVVGIPGRAAANDPNSRLAFNQRTGRCYELAAQYQLSNPGSTLVHGTIQGFGHDPIDHAWVQTADGKVFEPTSGHLMDQSQFDRYFNPQVGTSYSLSAAGHEMLDSGHYGPWGSEPQAIGPTGDWEKDATRVMGRVDEQMAAGRDTQTLYDRIDGKENKYTADREAQHQEIIDHFVNKPGVESGQQMLVMAGVPGAGKTSFLTSEEGQRAVGVDLGKYVVVNADDVKEEMAARGLVPNYPGLTNNESIALYHEESSYIAKQILTSALADGKNIAYDVTLSRPSQFTEAARLASQLGHNYATTAVLVDTPVETAISRAIGRYESGGRFLPTTFLDTMRAGDSTKPAQSFNQIRDMVDKWVTVNNRTETPVVTVNVNQVKVPA